MLIRTLTLGEILSFQWRTIVELNQLNVLIGPNGAGKSNLIECIALLQALPNSLNNFLSRSGGPNEWVRRSNTAVNSAVISCIYQLEGKTLHYQIGFSAVQNLVVVGSESLGSFESETKLLTYFVRSGNKLSIHPKLAQNVEGQLKSLNEALSDISSDVQSNDSLLAAYRNPFDPTPITKTAQVFDKIRVYRNFETGYRDGARRGVASDALKHPLDSNGTNLALVLQEMDFHNSLQGVKSYLRRLSNRFEDVKIRLEGGFAQVYVLERETGTIPATRLSDGTLKFLCLMAVLCDHNPPPLVCIEEPEIGLHPDALRLVGEALKEASKRMQIVVTTHSDALVDYFSDEPEAILVCERDTNDNTQFKRLQRDQLQEWMNDYTLGDLWRRGEIGGTLQ